jgi:hypothetical protein
LFPFIIVVVVVTIVIKQIKLHVSCPLFRTHFVWLTWLWLPLPNNVVAVVTIVVSSDIIVTVVVIIVIAAIVIKQIKLHVSCPLLRTPLGRLTWLWLPLPLGCSMNTPFL